MEPILCTISDAGAMLGVKRSTIYRLLERGKLKSAKLGTRRLVVVASIRALAEALATTRDRAHPAR